MFSKHTNSSKLVRSAIYIYIRQPDVLVLSTHVLIRIYKPLHGIQEASLYCHQKKTDITVKRSYKSLQFTIISSCLKKLSSHVIRQKTKFYLRCADYKPMTQQAAEMKQLLENNPRWHWVLTTIQHRFSETRVHPI